MLTVNFSRAIFSVFTASIVIAPNQYVVLDLRTYKTDAHLWATLLFIQSLALAILIGTRMPD